MRDAAVDEDVNTGRMGTVVEELARVLGNLPRLASRTWLPLHAAPAPLLPSRSAGRVRASRGSERDSVAPGSRRCCGVFVPTVQLALFRYRSDSEENCPGVLTLGPG